MLAEGHGSFYAAAWASSQHGAGANREGGEAAIPLGGQAQGGPRVPATTGYWLRLQDGHHRGPLDQGNPRSGQ